jgi:sterol desaturase/sphingolipid hydroxylase (fatty acid hydroxylase superfamily)
MQKSRLRARLAWLSFPVMMGGFVALAAWGLARGFDPARWGIALTLANFFTIVALERVLPRNPRMDLFRDDQAWNDVGHGILLAALARPLGGALSVGVLAWLAELRSAVGFTGLWPGGWPLAAQLAFGLLLWTFADYWIHRSLHSFDRLWWFHSVHHDTPQMHILKSGRIHFGEELYNAVLKPVPLLLLGAPPEVMSLIGMWIVFDGNLVHSNIDQRFPSWAHWFLPTVHLHNLHHAKDRRHQDSNYSGSTPIWDVVFGTFSHPDRCPLGPLGIEKSPVPVSFPSQVLFPFRAQLAAPEPRADTLRAAEP